MDNIEQINILRTQIPVGEKHAKRLLSETGSIDAAIRQFQQTMEILLQQKVPVSAEHAKNHLQITHYNLGQAITLAEEKLYSVTGVIIRKNKQPRDVVDGVYLAVQSAANINTPWLCDYHDEQLQNLNHEQRVLICLVGWMDYESWEGDLVIKNDIASFWQELGVHWLASSMQQIIALSQSNPKYWQLDDYKQLEQQYSKREHELYQCLYQFIVANKEKFPQ